MKKRYCVAFFDANNTPKYIFSVRHRACQEIDNSQRWFVLPSDFQKRSDWDLFQLPRQTATIGKRYAAIRYERPQGSRLAVLREQDALRLIGRRDRLARVANK